jgi:hypothetical protein
MPRYFRTPAGMHAEISSHKETDKSHELLERAQQERAATTNGREPREPKDSRDTANAGVILGDG